MNRNLVCTALAAAALCASFGAAAQDWQHDPRNTGGNYVQDRDHNFSPPEQPNREQWNREQRDAQERAWNRDHRDARDSRWDREHRDARRMGAYGDHHWRRGDRLPDEYRRREYVVHDWDRHHLNAPPRGYEWVNADGNYALVAIGSGVIADLR